VPDPIARPPASSTRTPGRPTLGASAGDAVAATATAAAAAGRTAVARAGEDAVSRPVVRPAVARSVVGVADYKVATGPDHQIVTFALGSCIGVTVWDPLAKVGGLLHFMLPTSKTNPEKAAGSPAMFADTGMPLLFRSAYELGAAKARLVVTAAGGAEILGGSDHFKIGHRNRTVLRKMFFQAGVLLKAEDCGGSDSRTMTLDLCDGTVTVKSRGTETTLWAA
jgi:chemotaxis protein CheD